MKILEEGSSKNSDYHLKTNQIHYLKGNQFVILSQVCKTLAKKPKQNLRELCDKAIEFAEKALLYFIKLNEEFIPTGCYLLGKMFSYRYGKFNQQNDLENCAKFLIKAYEKFSFERNREKLARIGRKFCPDRYDWPSLLDHNINNCFDEVIDRFELQSKDSELFSFN